MSFSRKPTILSPEKDIACLPSKVNIMPGRFSWKGYLRLSLVSIPVKSYPAVNACSSHGVSLNQLHEKCHSRIKYVKTCPIHGEVLPDEIVSGFEYEKGHYAVIEPSELDVLRTEADHAVTVQSVVPALTVDPLYLGGKTMYLVPDGKVGQSAYAVLQRALADENLIGVAQVVLNGKENTVLLRPASKLIAMVSVNYSDEVTLPSDHDREVTAEGSAAEVKMIKTLLGTPPGTSPCTRGNA
jgi:DNA end-binding protein Ku